MNNPRKTSMAQSLAAALAWWEEAGVDMDFADEPTQWLAESDTSDAAQGADGPHSAANHNKPPTGQNNASPHKAPPAPANIKPIGKDENAPPDDIAAFQSWWKENSTLDIGGTGQRIAPRGNPGADLMVLVAEPEREDRDALLSGPQGKLLDAILRAMAIPTDGVYVAAALPRHTPHPDWEELASAGLRDVTLQHVRLAAPRRLLVFGRNILPLLSNDPAKISTSYHEINHDSARVLVFTSWDLGTLLLRAKARSSFWRNWLDWTEGKA
ncbi:MAG: hypothetical protein KDE63_06925 [Novosphingobium sp.]|nr:hypothetical protein [Novosphingobium sp.]